MQEKSLEYKEHLLHYKRYGSGPRHIIAFHGFADDSSLWAEIEGYLQEHSFWALDMPFHGQTLWRAKRFSPQDCIELLEALRQQEGIEDYSLLAYSMGGHIALHLLPLLPKVPERIFLAGPAALKRSADQSRYAFPPCVRRLLRRSLDRPIVLKSIFFLAEKTGLLNESTASFFNKQLKNEKNRHRMLDVWISLYYFPIRKKALAEFLRREQPELHFIYGTRDKITPLWAAKRFLKKLGDMPQIQIHTLSDDHFLFRRKAVYPLLAKALGELGEKSQENA